MILVIHERKAPLYRGRPDFMLVQNYGGKINPIIPGEIGFYYDEVTPKQVRVVASTNVPLKDPKGNNVLGWMMSEQAYEFFQKKPLVKPPNSV